MTDKEEKQSQLEGTDAWIVLVFGIRLSSFLEDNLTEYVEKYTGKLLVAELLLVPVSFCIGIGFMLFVRRCLRRCA